MSKLDLRKQYLQLAYNQLHPEGNDLKALEQVLINWFCLKFETTPNDPRILGMRLDELLVFRMMHEIADRPSVMEEVGTQADEFENWLKREMGDGYKSSDQMVESHEKLEEEERSVAARMPDRIDTDFKNVRGE